MLRKIGTVLLGVVWSLLIFTLSSPLLFPTEALEKRAEYWVQETTRGKTLIDLTDLSFLGVAGLSGKVDLYKGQRLRKRRKRRQTAGTTGSPPVHLLTIDSFNLRPQILPLLFGKIMASYDIETEGAKLEGAAGWSPDAIFLDSDTEGLDLSLLPALDNDDVFLNFAGKANIISDLELGTKDAKDSSGSLTLTIEDLQLLNGKVKKYGVDLMPASFTESILKFEIEEGRAKVTEGRFIGDLIEAEVEGDIILNKRPMRSRLALKIKLKIVDTTMESMVKNLSTMKRIRDDEGYYHYRASGTVGSPRFMPDRAKSRGSSRGGSLGLDGDKPARRTQRFSDDDADERRRKRRERIKKRRERMKERRRKRRERDQLKGDDDLEDDGLQDEEPPRRRQRRRFDDPEPEGNQMPTDNDFPPEPRELDYEDEDVQDEERVEEPLEDLGYVNE